jgi:hypothetical protein
MVELLDIKNKIKKLSENPNIPWQIDDTLSVVHDPVNKPQKAAKSDPKKSPQEIPINPDHMIGKGMDTTGSQYQEVSTHETTWDRAHGENRIGEAQKPIEIVKATNSLDAPKQLNNEKCEPIKAKSEPDNLIKELDLLLKSNLIPVTTIVHYKSGKVKTSIRWKKPESIGIKKVESQHELKGVIHVSESKTFTQNSKLKQTMFVLTDSMDNSALYNNEYLPTDEHPKYGSGIYLYNDLERAKKENTEDKTILPAKVNIGNPYAIVNNSNWSEDFKDNLTNLGYDSIYIPSGQAQVFDIFIFDQRLIRILGEDGKNE